MFDKLPVVPNFFYDFIVYLIPTIGLVLGISLGMTGNVAGLEKIVSNAGVVEAITTILLLFFASYEYGRLAETYSHFFVGSVISHLSHLGVFKNSDFRRAMTFQVSQLPIKIEQLEGRTADKWSIYFFSYVVNPDIGNDLMKRYAWEKLARSSGFTVLLLFTISVALYVRHNLENSVSLHDDLSFGGIRYPIVMGCLYVALLIDYYKRNCWNNDLIIKTLPILIADYQILSSKRKTNAEES
jgi:hypothetical protein